MPAIRDPAAAPALPIDVGEPVPVVRLAHVSTSFTLPGGGRVAALQDVTLDVRAGEVLGVVGRNGAGKSTLLRSINLLDRPDSGRVSVAGQDLPGLHDRALRAARQQIGMVFQQVHLLQGASVADNVAFPLRLHGRLNAPRLQARLREVLELAGIARHASSFPARLTEAERRRVALAQAIANHPAVLLCDDPSAGLDGESTRELFDTIDRINRELGLAVVIASHELAQLGGLCDRAAVLHEGVLVEQFALSDTSAPRASSLGRELAYYSGEAWAACQWDGGARA